MIRHEIHDHADSPLSGFGDKLIKIGECAELRVDGRVIRNIVAKVDLWRRIYGCNPDGVNAQVLQIAQAGGDSVQISDTIAIRILKAARVDFLNDGMLPPRVLGACS